MRECRQRRTDPDATRPVEAFLRSCNANAPKFEGNSKCITCLWANSWLGIVRISSLTLRPSGVILRNVRASVFPYPQPFKLYIGPRQNRRKVNRHTVKLSICYRTNYLAWEGGGGTFPCLSTGKWKKALQCYEFSGRRSERFVKNARLQIRGYRSCVFLYFQIEMMDQKYFLLS